MPRHYRLTDLDSGVQTVIRADNDKAAVRKARDWVTERSDGITGTVWCHVDVGRLDRRGVERLTVTIDPPEPKCGSDLGHNWRQDWCKGNGGGGIIHETCCYCMTVKRTDTWDTDPFNGTQGHRHVSYSFSAD